MRRDAPRIGVEVLLLGLILAALGAAVGLIVHAHRRAAMKPATVVQVVEVKTPEEPPDPPAPPPPAPVDLTPERLRPIAAKVAEEKARAEAEALRAARLDAAIDLAEAEARRLLGEAAKVRDEAASREAATLATERQRDDLARERDVLAEKRDETRATLERQRLRSRDGVAVLPYKGANGTWRRPIAIECRGDRATLQPGGPSFSMGDMTTFANPRRSPLVFAVAKAMVRARSTRTPDGAASVPYLMFIVRPDGVRPYYAARTLLEPLGIAYGYELADADWDIEFPDLDDPSEWAEIPGGKPAATWPPPPTDAPPPGGGLAARGGREADGVGPSATGNAGRLPGGGPGGTLGLPRPAGGAGLAGAPGRGWPGGDGLDAAANRPGAAGAPSGTGLGGRPLASPGDGRGIPGGTSPGRGGAGIGDFPDMAELERLGRGDPGGPPTPKDGRVPWQPGQLASAPSPMFQPTPTVNGAGAGRPSDERAQPGREPGGVAGMTGAAAGRPGESRAAGSPNPGGVNDPSTGGGTPRFAGGGAPSVAGSRPLSEAIARQNRLVAPTAPNPPDRSGGGNASAPGGSGTATAASGGGSPGGGGGPQGTGTPGHGRGSAADPYASRSLPIVVSCDKSGLTIHPGGETIPFDVLSRDDAAFPAKLRALVKANQDAEPEVGMRPRVNFLVKPGGEVSYLKARWQATTGTSYPTTWQLVDRGGPRLPELETR